MESKLSLKEEQDIFFTNWNFNSNNIKVSKCVKKKNRKSICFYNRNTIYKIINVTLVKENKDTGFISGLTGGTKIAD